MKGGLRFVLAGVIFITQGTGHAAESMFWSQRRSAACRQSDAVPTATASRAGDDAPALPPLPRHSSDVTAWGDETSVFFPSAGPTRNTPSWVRSALLPHGVLQNIQWAPNPEAPFVVLIQDIHGVPSAQENIAQMIQGLGTARGPSPLLVGLEGAAGAVDLKDLRGPSPSANEEVGRFFFNTGYIGGAELAAFTLPGDPVFVGLEDKALYLENVAVLRRALPRRDVLSARRAGWAAALDSEKNKGYSPRQKALDRLLQDRAAERLPWGEGVERLWNFARPTERRFPAIARFVDARRRERELDIDAVEAERDRALREAVARLSDGDRRALVKGSEDFRQGRVPYAAFYDGLETLLRRAGWDPRGAPAFAAYLRYVRAADGLSPRALFEEIDALEEWAWTHTRPTPAQDQLRTADTDLRLADRLIRLNMTPADWRAHARRRGAVVELPARWMAADDGWADAVADAEAFYARAEDRNEALASRFLNALDAVPTDGAVLVAGGFHTDAVARRVSRRAHVIVVSPKLNPVDTRRGGDALNVFTAGRLPLDRLFAASRLALADTPAIWPIDGSKTAVRRLAKPLRDAVTAFLDEGALRDNVVVRGGAALVRLNNGVDVVFYSRGNPRAAFPELGQQIPVAEGLGKTGRFAIFGPPRESPPPAFAAAGPSAIASRLSREGWTALADALQGVVAFDGIRGALRPGADVGAAPAPLPGLGAALRTGEQLRRDHRSSATLLRWRADKLLEDTRRLVAGPLEAYHRWEKALRATLLDDYSDVITYEDFINDKAIPFLRARARSPRASGRTLIGFAGQAASGKTTYAEKAGADLSAHFPRHRVVLLTFDDFLREKGDRADPASEDPRVKFNIERYRRFVTDLAANRRATKPLYDQTAKGQLKFGVDAEGRFVLYNGARTLIVADAPDGTFSVEERARDGGTAPWPGANRVTATEFFTWGSTPVRFERRDNGGLRVAVRRNRRETVFDVERVNGALILHTPGEPPVALTPERKAEALEVWEPYDPLGEWDGEIVLGEGIFALAAEDYDMTVEVNAEFLARRRRSIMRELRRGRTLQEIETNAANVAVRQFTEDGPIEALNLRAANARGRGAAVESHFQISSVSLAEQIIVNAFYKRIKPKHVNYFRSQNIDLIRWVDEAFERGDQALAAWFENARAEHVKTGRGFPFYEDRFVGPTPSLADIHDRGFGQGHVTLVVGPFLMMKFDRRPDGTGGLAPDTREHLEGLLARTNGLFAGAQIVDLKNRLRGPVAHETLEKTEAGVVRGFTRLPVDAALFVDQLPFLESRLAEAAADPNRWAEGRGWIDAFFDLQERFWNLGLVDTEPRMAKRYGIAFYDGRETLMATAPRGLRLDAAGKAAVSAIAAVEDADPAFDQSPHRDIPGFLALRGYQRRYVRNADLGGEDYLSAIPAPFRAYYLERLRRAVPVDTADLEGHYRFGREWAGAVAAKNAERYRNTGVSSVIIDDARIGHAEAMLAHDALDRLARYFEEWFRNRAPVERVVSLPALAWVTLCEGSLTPDPSDALYAWTKELQRRLSENPRWLETLKSSARSRAETAEDVFAQIDANVRADAQRHGVLAPVAKAWQKDLFLKLARAAVWYPVEWESFAREGVFAVAMDRDKARVSLVDPDTREIHDSREIPVPARNADVFFDRLAHLIQKIGAAARRRGIRTFPIVAVGAPGRFVRGGARGRVVAPGSLRGVNGHEDFFDGRDFEGELSRRLDARVLVRNDAVARMGYVVEALLNRPKTADLLRGQTVAYLRAHRGLGGGFARVALDGRIEDVTDGHVFDVRLNDAPLRWRIPGKDGPVDLSSPPYAEAAFSRAAADRLLRAIDERQSGEGRSVRPAAVDPVDRLEGALARRAHDDAERTIAHGVADFLGVSLARLLEKIHTGDVRKDDPRADWTDADRRSVAGARVFVLDGPLFSGHLGARIVESARAYLTQRLPGDFHLVPTADAFPQALAMGAVSYAESLVAEYKDAGPAYAAPGSLFPWAGRYTRWIAPWAETLGVAAAGVWAGSGAGAGAPVAAFVIAMLGMSAAHVLTVGVGRALWPRAFVGDVATGPVLHRGVIAVSWEAGLVAAVAAASVIGGSVALTGAAAGLAGVAVARHFRRNAPTAGLVWTDIDERRVAAGRAALERWSREHTLPPLWMSLLLENNIGPTQNHLIDALGDRHGVALGALDTAWRARSDAVLAQIGALAEETRPSARNAQGRRLAELMAARFAAEPAAAADAWAALGPVAGFEAGPPAAFDGARARRGSTDRFEPLMAQWLGRSAPSIRRGLSFRDEPVFAADDVGFRTDRSVVLLCLDGLAEGATAADRTAQNAAAFVLSRAGRLERRAFLVRAPLGAEPERIAALWRDRLERAARRYGLTAADLRAVPVVAVFETEPGERITRDRLRRAIEKEWGFRPDRVTVHTASVRGFDRRDFGEFLVPLRPLRLMKALAEELEKTKILARQA